MAQTSLSLSLSLSFGWNCSFLTYIRIHGWICGRCDMKHQSKGREYFLVQNATRTLGKANYIRLHSPCTCFHLKCYIATCIWDPQKRIRQKRPQRSSIFPLPSPASSPFKNTFRTWIVKNSTVKNIRQNQKQANAVFKIHQKPTFHLASFSSSASFELYFFSGDLFLPCLSTASLLSVKFSWLAFKWKMSPVSRRKLPNFAQIELWPSSSLFYSFTVLARLQADMGSSRIRRSGHASCAFWSHLETGHCTLQ